MTLAEAKELDVGAGDDRSRSRRGANSTARSGELALELRATHQRSKDADPE